MKKNFLRTCLFLTLFGSVSMTARAATLFDEDFENGASNSDLANIGWTGDVANAQRTYASSFSGNPFDSTAALGVTGTGASSYYKAFNDSATFEDGKSYQARINAYTFAAADANTGSSGSGIRFVDASGNALVHILYMYTTTRQWRVIVDGTSIYYDAADSVDAAVDITVNFDLTGASDTISIDFISDGGTVSTGDLAISNAESIAGMGIRADMRSSRLGTPIDNMTVVPEPATMSLLVLGAVAGICRRKRR